MRLFRRLLISLFPSDFTSNGMNPIAMFVGFISPKPFFSIVHRRIVENFKLNLFDIGLESFEAKLGIGDHQPLTVKNSDFYFGYANVANMNGWSFYSPANLSTLVTMISSVVLKEELKGYDQHYANGFLTTIHYLTFVFVARVKIFPKTTKEEQYQWFIELFFTFYKVALRKRGVKVDIKILAEIKSTVMKKIQLFFMLFYYYQRMNTLFSHQGISPKEYYQRLFYDEMKPGPLHAVVNGFVNDYEARTVSTKFTRDDQKILKLILPADSQLKYLYQDDDRYLVADVLLEFVFEDLDLDAQLRPFLKDGSSLESFLTTLMDHTRFKKQYFAGCKKLAQKKFKNEQSYEVAKEIDSFMSTIEETGSMEGVKVPEELKAESMLMDRLLNFYVTFIGGLWIGRGDTFYSRLFRKPLVEELVGILQKRVMQQDSLYYYGGLLYGYSKNIFYYKYAYDNVRAGNQSFQLPIKPTFKEVYSNMYIFKLFDEYFVNVVIQDINKKTIKLSVSNEIIMDQFKDLVGNPLGGMLSLEGEEFIDAFYRPLLQHILSGEECIEVLKNHLHEGDISIMKDNLYTIDNWVWRDGLESLEKFDAELSLIYGDMSVLGMLSTMRETLFGLLLYYTYLTEKEILLARPLCTQELLTIYCVDVLNVSEEYATVFKAMIVELSSKYHELLVQWIEIDDNKKFLGLARKNRNIYCKKHGPEKVTQFISGEDTVWLRGFFKTVTYYNKRYLIPGS